MLPTGTKLTLDGAAVTQTPQAIGASFGVLRLDATTSDHRRLEADKPFGVSVIGHGSYTSYAHVAGMSVHAL